MNEIKLRCIEEGGYKVSSDEEIVIKLKRKDDELVNTIKELSEGHKLLANKVLEDRKKIANEYVKKLDNNKAAKTGCGRLADAMIIVDAVRGKKLKEMLVIKYPCKIYTRGGTKQHVSKKTYSDRKIKDATRVQDMSDIERINKLMEDFPEVFAAVSREDVYNWAQKKMNKTKNMRRN